MTLYLIRHGETALNAARVLQPAATPLSERGLAQAQALAQRLKSASITALLSSDMPRALQTAQAVAAACDLPIKTSALLHERNFGDLRGLPYDLLGYNPLTADEAPPNGESGAQFAARCQAAWAEVLRLQAECGGTLAVVSHGLVLHQWLQPQRIDFGDHASPEAWANTSLSIVQAAPPHRLELINCTRHLNDSDQHDSRSLSGG